jgi:uncharacterized repeat protein (TIGR02543 family)
VGKESSASARSQNAAWSLAFFLALIPPLIPPIANAQSLDFSWFTVDGGGGVSAVGALQISGTIGQPDAGAATVGSLKLEGGFWPGVTAGQPPGITLQPQNLIVGAGSNAVFNVAASGGLPLAYQWRHSGTNLPGATSSALTLTGVQSADAGLYDAVVSNPHGAVTSAVATLRVVFVFITADGQPLLDPAYTHEGPSQVALESAYPGGLVYYTLDGAPPDFLSGTPYLGPFIVSASATLRSATYDSGFGGYTEEQPVQFTILPGFRLFATTAGGGSVTVNPASPFYARDTLVTLIAAPAPNWTFLGWTGDAAGTNPVTTVTMTRDLRVQAVFGAPLNVVVVPPGGGGVNRAPNLPLYPYGTAITLTAQPAAGNYLFLWGGAPNPTNNPQTIVLTTAPRSVSALFSNLPPGEVALVLSATGNGRITNSPRGNRFPAGTVVTVTATPDAGQEFLGWTGNAAGMANPLLLALDVSKSVTGQFTRRPRLAAAGETSLSGQTAVRLTITGDIGERYDVTASQDFTAWDPFATLTNQFGTAQTVDTNASLRARRFFRAQTLP